MKDALDERGVGGSEFHTNSILEAIKNSETRMLNSVLNTCPLLISEDNSGIVSIIDEDSALDNVTEGISKENISNGGPIQDASELEL